VRAFDFTRLLFVSTPAKAVYFRFTPEYGKIWQSMA
jgi:hypothetical protein